MRWSSRISLVWAAGDAWISLNLMWVGNYGTNLGSRHSYRPGYWRGEFCTWLVRPGTEGRSGPFRGEGAGVTRAALSPRTSQEQSQVVELGLGAIRKKPLSSAMRTFFYFFVLFLASKYWLVLTSALWLLWSFACLCGGIRLMAGKRHFGNQRARWKGSFFHQVCKIQFSNKGCHHVSMFSAENRRLSVATFFFYKCRRLHFK